MSIWLYPVSLGDLDAMNRKTAAEHVGIRFTAFGDNWLEATMPLDARTQSEPGTMHRGALAILAETLGSQAANLCVDQSRQVAVGQILHLNHPVEVTSGPICGRALPLSRNNLSQVWEIDIRDSADARLCVAQLTMAVLDRPSAGAILKNTAVEIPRS